MTSKQKRRGDAAISLRVTIVSIIIIIIPAAIVLFFFLFFLVRFFPKTNRGGQTVRRAGVKVLGIESVHALLYAF